MDLGAIAEDDLSTVEFAEDDVFEGRLKGGTHWYRLPVRSGQMQVETIGKGTDAVRSMELFDGDGNPLGAAGADAKTDLLYLRVHVQGDASDDTSLKIWWE